MKCGTHFNKIYRNCLPFFFGIVFILWLVALYILVIFLSSSLPTPLTIKDEIENPDAFITERAIRDLKFLAHLGPRITGGHTNEILTVDFLNEKVKEIINQTHKNQKLKLSSQVASGAFILEQRTTEFGEINAYANLQNVVAKLYGRNESGYSLIVNAHFDSVPTSPGASDDGINVAAMLEIMRKLSRSPKRLENNVIFLFNGAEEAEMRGSHAYIANHRWANGSKILINLEASGTGGKLNLFQTGPGTSWLLDYYVKVPRPTGAVTGEEAFQAGLIPSDTDFRMFRDFAGTAGYDSAFVDGGYRYHTKYDNFKSIPPGSLQHVGDNTLALIKLVANAPEFPTETTEKAVYFDVFSWFMITYTETTATAINLITAVISVVAFLISWFDFKLSKRNTVFIFLSLVAIILGWILAFLATYITAQLMDTLYNTMRWYGHRYLIFGLYVVPTIGASGSLLVLIRAGSLSLSQKCQIQAHLVRLVWTLIFVIGTLANIRSIFVLLFPISFNTLGFICIHLFRWHTRKWRWLIIYLLSLLFPTILVMYQSMSITTLIASSGRGGPASNPELTIGIYALLYTLIAISPYVVLTNLLRKVRYYYNALAIIYIAFFAISFTPLGFPYSGNWDNPTPQRFWLMHSHRVFHDESGRIEKKDSGVAFLNMDRNSPRSVREYVKDLNKAESVERDCEKYLLCGLPLSHGKYLGIMKYSTWVPASDPVIPEPLTFTLNSVEKISSIIRYNVTIRGPDRTSVYLRGRNNAILVNTSLTEEFNIEQTEDTIFVIINTYGKYSADFKFTFDMEIPGTFEANSTVDIAVTARYIHEETMQKTPYYINFINDFPEWADVTAWVGIYKSYVI